jgi:hypothetical protein
MIPKTWPLLLTLAMLMGLQPLQAGKEKSLTDKEAAALKSRRDLADAFMRQATEAALAHLDQAKETKDRKEIKEYLQNQLARKRYFDAGTDLLEFKQLLSAADASKIKLTDAAVQELVKAATRQQLDEKGLKKIEEEVRKKHGDATSQMLTEALASEFRVRIVRELNAKKK